MRGKHLTGEEHPKNMQSTGTFIRKDNTANNVYPCSMAEPELEEDTILNQVTLTLKHKNTEGHNAKHKMNSR